MKTSNDPRTVPLEFEADEENEIESLVVSSSTHANNTHNNRITPRHLCLFVVAQCILLFIGCVSRSATFTSLYKGDLRAKENRLSWLDEDEDQWDITSDVTTASADTNNNKNKMVTQVHANDGKVYNVSSLAALQIENYRQGTGLFVNIHITHHGGTSMCTLLGRSPDASGRAPNASCNWEPDMHNKTGYDYKKVPWRANETASMIHTVRQSFHFVGWEFGYAGRHPNPNLNQTQWEDPNLFSVLVVRDPISRLLAGDGWVRQRIPNVHYGNATHEDWWALANSTWHTNNYALNVLAGEGCCSGAQTDREYLERAKRLVNRFSIVLDINCLSEGIDAIANLLNITQQDNRRSKNKSHGHAPSRERIGHDDVYEYLLEKNKHDIELYEWSKQRALINCSKNLT